MLLFLAGLVAAAASSLFAFAPPQWSTILATILLIAAATFVSEDLTCITTGLLIHQGKLSLTVGLTGCLIGVYVGDLLLWAVGRLAWGAMRRWRLVARRLPQERMDRLGEWFDRHTARAILASRFLPGTRLPMYLAAGALARRSGRFMLWTLVAALLWVPALVLLSASLGEAFMLPCVSCLGVGLWSLAGAAMLVLLLVRIGAMLATPLGRARFAARVSRLWRFEFWPAWIFYIPLVPWLAWLSIRHRGFTTITAANPGIPHGGFVGESKFDILSKLPEEHVASFALIDACDSPSSHEQAVKNVADQRLARLHDWLAAGRFSFPVILKPDAGQRGVGVKLIRTIEEAAAYLRDNPNPVLVQAYHAGPFEAGVFYYRIPSETRGRILSITDKHFPQLVGDGTHTVEELIWCHPRFRMQAGTFLKRHAGQRERVLAAGEEMCLARAGNHCQGTMFRDGAHLITPQLEAAIDRIANAFDGFYFGRFDLRYHDLEAFKDGRGFSIIELNGVTSESTNIYDPSRSLLSAYRILFKQWAILFRIGGLNRRRGHAPTGVRALLREIRGHYRDRRVSLVAD